MAKVTPLFVLVVIVFVCYTLFLIMRRSFETRSFEPMDNPPSCLGPIENESVPSCASGTGTDTASNVPGCYSTVRGDVYNGFMSDFMSSDYILKTQMVTPVCPNNPVGEVGTEYGKEDRIITPEDDTKKGDAKKDDEKKDGTKKDDAKKGDEKGVTKKDAAKTDFDPAKPDASKTDGSKSSIFSSDLFGSGSGTYSGTGSGQGSGQGSGTASGSGQGQGSGQGSGTASGSGKGQGSGSSAGSGSSNEASKNTYLLNAPRVAKPEPSRGSCPPCPACQRCPEPVVECKRIVNYNAAGVSNLPVPMIADFSKF